MPAPQTWSTYRRRFLTLPGGKEQYVRYGDELIEKWAVVGLTTCHTIFASAVMAYVGGISGALAEKQIIAKQVRDRDWFVVLNAKRYFVSKQLIEDFLCEPNVSGFNVFVQGIEKGFTPLQPADVATSKEPVALLKSYSLLRILGQVVREEYVAIDGVSVQNSDANLDDWANAINERIILLTEDVDLTDAQRLIASRAQSQVDTLDLWKSIRNTADGDTTCTRLAAGYEVPVKQTIVEVIGNAASTLPAPVESQSQDTASPTTSQPLGEIVTNAQPEAIVTPAQVVWPEATASVKPTLRVGQMVSKSSLVAQAGLVTASKSNVTLMQRSPKSICAVRSTGVKAIKVGTCKVRISIATKGKKTQTKNLSLTIAK